ncbi:MAG TPA: putative ABC transporter permease [Anaerovoracaceae bacterium]|nr:putative ABC transporter permease [Anaerovoracaceae bacterium]
MTEILLYLYIYSFIGWIYESIYVSIKKKRWINRGFMHGPFLTIYGFGGILCVLSGSLSQGETLTMFIYAVFICSLMELVTGVTMEKLFRVRYWDYTNIPFNVRGYICPPVSLFWGVLAIIVNRYIHVYLTGALSVVSQSYLELFTYVLTIVFAVDFTISFMEATDLRKMLEVISERNRSIEDIKLRFEDVKEMIPIDTSSLKIFSLGMRDSINESQKSFDLKIEQHYNKQRETLDKLKDRIRELPEKKDKVFEFSVSVSKLQNLMKNGLNQISKGPKKMLKRNPYITSTDYKEILEMLKKINN